MGTVRYTLSRMKFLMILIGSVFSQYEGPIPGTPGDDYPVFSQLPATSFSCAGLVTGYYADLESDCQMYHRCGTNGEKISSLLCPNGTLYNQQFFVCDWWFNVDCLIAEKFYYLNIEVRNAAENANQLRAENLRRGK